MFITFLSDTTVRINPPARVLVAALVWLLQALACGGKTPIQPPPPPPDQLRISCPADVVVEASRPDGADVQFDSPQPMGGRSPYAVECTPAPGTAVPLG